MNWIIGSILIAFLYSISAINQKVSVKRLQPSQSFLALLIVQFIITFIYLSFYYRDTKNTFKITRQKEWIVLFFSVLFSIFIPNRIFLSLLKGEEVHKVATLSYIAPIFILIFSFFFLKEHITSLGFTGIILITVGSILLCL